MNSFRFGGFNTHAVLDDAYSVLLACGIEARHSTTPPYSSCMADLRCRSVPIFPFHSLKFYDFARSHDYRGWYDICVHRSGERSMQAYEGSRCSGLRLGMQ